MVLASSPAYRHQAFRLGDAAWGVQGHPEVTGDIAAAWHPIGYFLKNARGEWLAGLTGYVWGGWMHVNFIWVTESLRGQRHGTRLMDAAESFAIGHACIGATLETHSFQAPGFYAKRGYEVFGTLADYPPGHSKLFLRKSLRNPDLRRDAPSGIVGVPSATTERR